MTKKRSRRQFVGRSSALGLAGLSSNAASLLLQSLVAGWSQKSHAQSMGITPKTYIHLFQRYAPPRWNFDTFLTANDGEQAIANIPAQVGTRFTEGVAGNAGRYDDLVYETTKIGNFNVPHLWSTMVPKADGTYRALSDLLPNLLHVRGLETNDAHEIAQSMTQRPMGSPITLSALSADYSKKSIDALHYVPPPLNPQASTDFRSARGKAPIELTMDSGNLVERLLDPFKPINPDSSLAENRAALQASVADLTSVLNNQATTYHPGMESMVASQANVESLLVQSFDDLSTTWTDLLAKYESLISRAWDFSVAGGPIPGITDMPVGALENRNDQDYQVGAIFPFVPDQEDFRNMFAPRPDDPLTIRCLAESFAVLEYVTTNQLCDAMTIGLQSFDNLINSAFQLPQLIWDEHVTGKMFSTLVNAVYNRALGACMLELIDQLKAKDLWDNTVVNLASEFNRSPRVGGTGSDHGSDAQSFSFFSGSVKEMQIVGNIRLESGRETHPGTWGNKATNPGLDSPYIEHAHIQSTLASIIGVPTPSINRQSLVKIEDGEVKSLLPTGKIVDEPGPDPSED